MRHDRATALQGQGRTDDFIRRDVDVEVGHVGIEADGSPGRRRRGDEEAVAVERRGGGAVAEADEPVDVLVCNAISAWWLALEGMKLIGTETWPGLPRPRLKVRSVPSRQVSSSWSAGPPRPEMPVGHATLTTSGSLFARLMK
jgi:hypothetical protein